MTGLIAVSETIKTRRTASLRVRYRCKEWVYSSVDSLDQSYLYLSSSPFTLGRIRIDSESMREYP